MTEDDFIYWQDIFDSIAAGRTDSLKCPFCYQGVIAVTQVEAKTRLECQRCHHFVEGRFGEDAD